MSEPRTRIRRVLARGSYQEALRIGEILRKETTGGLLLMVGAILALLWANSEHADSYVALRDMPLPIGPLHLTVGEWAADGLLAVFFFLVGLELKREFVSGDLRDPAKALVPVAAAFGGVAVPAVLYTVVNLSSPLTLRGWAIPTATDIAFAVAVLAIIGSHLPSALRIFLLTLAVVDDLIAIFIIAAVYTSGVNWLPLALFLVPAGLFTYLAQRHRRFFAQRTWAPWLILLPLGIVAWACMHESGIHATISVCCSGSPSRDPVRPQASAGLAEIFDAATARCRPDSRCRCSPSSLPGSIRRQGAGLVVQPVTMGIIVGLVWGSR